MQAERPNHALQRTRHERRGCNHGVPLAGSLSLGRWTGKEMKMNRFAITAAILALTAGMVVSAQTTDVLLQIEQMVFDAGKADRSLEESIVDGVEKSPAHVSKALIKRLNDEKLTEQQLAVYVWALGLTKDQKAVAPIDAVHKQSKSDLVKANCLCALAMIGGQRAEKLLLSALDATTDTSRRFDILNRLGQMQSEAALPKAEEILKLEIQKFYWQPIFVFGKMGDKAIPFLLTKINDKDRNIRANSISVLGQWLIPTEAAKPLQDQFWAEKDMELRVTILGSLERMMPDLAAMKAFFEQVADKEKEKDVVKFARETLDNMNKIKAAMATFTQKKQPSAEAFLREHAQLFKSAGKKGSYDILGIASTVDDEPHLKCLRERILQRDSDEAFYDYQKVNAIIMWNRMLKTTPDMKTVQPRIGGDGKPAPQP